MPLARHQGQGDRRSGRDPLTDYPRLGLRGWARGLLGLGLVPSRARPCDACLVPSLPRHALREELDRRQVGRSGDTVSAAWCEGHQAYFVDLAEIWILDL